MIGRPAMLAALTLAPLLLASPAAAQVGPVDGEVQRPTLGPSAAEAQGRRSDFVGTDGSLFPKARRGVSASTQPFVNDDGTRGTRTGLVGTVPVAPGTSIGVGLFSINRTSARERSIGRLQPTRDVNERGSKMAAVGLSVRFE